MMSWLASRMTALSFSSTSPAATSPRVVSPSPDASSALSSPRMLPITPVALDLRDLVLVEQDRLDVHLAAARLGEGGGELGLGDAVLSEEIVELRLRSALALEELVVEGDAEGLRDPGHPGLVLLRESGALPLVEELDDAGGPPLVRDRHREDLLGPEAGLLVPGAVEAERGRDLRELTLVVGVGA